MKKREELVRGTRGPDGGADFVAERHGGMVTLLPLHERAEMWLRAKVSTEANWSGEALVVELRFFPPLADAVIDAGFKFERADWVQ